MNKHDVVAVASRSFSNNDFLVSELKKLYSKVILNESGKTLKGDELINFLQRANKAIIGIEKISDTVISNLPNLRVISKYGVGLNNLDLKLLKKKNVRLGFTPGVNKQSVAELALTHIFIGLKKIHENNIDILNGNWSQEKGTELFGKTVGILGFGNIGQKLAALIQPFDCNILFFDKRDFSRQDIKLLSMELNFNSEIIKQSTLETLLVKSDILSIHLPLISETKNIISSKELAKLKANICIVNTARGGIINEEDLYLFLQANPNAFAGFDVFNKEPAFQNPLLELPNFFGTSHRSSLTTEGINSMGIAAIKGLDDNIDIK